MTSKKAKIKGHRDSNPMALYTKDNILKRNTAFQVSIVRKCQKRKRMSILQKENVNPAKHST